MSITPLINTVAEFYSVSPDDIRSARRKQELVKARQAVYYLARIKNHLSYPKIGRALLRRDHSAVISGFKKISLELLKNDNLRNEIEYISSILDKAPLDQNLISKITQIKKEEKEKKRKRARKKVFPNEQVKRMKIVLEMYRIGWTFEDVAAAFKITRERIRQIVMSALEYEITQGSSRNISESEIEEFISEEKKSHLLERRKRYKKPEKIKVVREERWSWDYDHCRRCGRNTVKHRSNGYCIWCYPKTEIFKRQQKESRLRNIKKRKTREKEYRKEYSKRPEVIAKIKLKEDIRRYGGNREKALKRDNYKCQGCGMSQRQSLEKLERDLYVYHLKDTKDNRLDNLITLCQKCFNEKSVKLMWKRRL
jgi:5-methylcytosine-specific restriction endonuclease McrA/uncharacterized protein (DUF433 family)